MAGAIYVFQRKDLYGLGRKAVLMGLLSYSFVTVTLIADLGLPWHFYQLGRSAPRPLGDVRGLVVRRALRHDPRAGVPPGRPGDGTASTELLALWQKWSGAYVAFAVTLFVF